MRRCAGRLGCGTAQPGRRGTRGGEPTNHERWPGNKKCCRSYAHDLEEPPPFHRDWCLSSQGRATEAASRTGRTRHGEPSLQRPHAAVTRESQGQPTCRVREVCSEEVRLGSPRSGEPKEQRDRRAHQRAETEEP